MYVGEIDKKQMVSITLMIIFTMVVMFFLGYKLAYDKAIASANDQIQEIVDEFKADYGLKENTPIWDVVALPNITGGDING